MSLKEISPRDFDQYVSTHHPEANFLQSSNWGELYQLNGYQVFYLALVQKKQILAAALAILKKARRGIYLEIPGGPLTDWQDENLLRQLMDGISKLAKTHHCVFVRMRPNIPDTPENQQIAKRLGLRMSPMHLHAEHTVILDLSLPLDQLMRYFRRQTRYEVRRAAKIGIKVDFSTTKSAFEDFYNLQLETAERQHFIPSSREFILRQHDAFGDEARIYTASLEGEILAKGLIIMHGNEVVYNEAASTPASRKLPGAYALQWQVIQDAKQLGFPRYNLFGIAPPNSPHHRYAGVTTFKTGFGGQQISYLPAQDLIIRPLRYRFVHLIEKIRKKRRHL